MTAHDTSALRSPTSRTKTLGEMTSPRCKRAVRRCRSASITATALLPIAALLSAPAHAYVGPGAGLGVIGTLFGIVAALVLALFGLFWYPLKRAFGKRAMAGGVPTPDTTSRLASGDTARPVSSDDAGVGHEDSNARDAVRREAADNGDGGTR